MLGGLTCQVIWYLIAIALFGGMGPLRFLRGATDVMASTFSTASTAATIPITLRALTTRLGVSRESSQLAACSTLTLVRCFWSRASAMRALSSLRA